MTIAYRLGNKLYLNITNECSCNCVFCIRNNTDGVGDAKNLWLEREPSLEEIKIALDKKLMVNPDIDEVVFCGYGEPMMRADVVIEISEYIKRNHSSLYEKSALLVRINTNGLAFLMQPGFDVRRLGVVDTVSISLNADDAEEYQRMARPKYEGAFESLLEFARQAKVYTAVVFSVVEGTISPERLENCRRIADNIGVPLRVRDME
ncbi:MAG: TatD family nuclease-associated radical SAM protein [Defluviitaleaceae bacterium]|nr:TatD family nuclease-associated radical SAM protein [Defluviitaleaceae bacterium]